MYRRSINSCLGLDYKVRPALIRLLSLSTLRTFLNNLECYTVYIQTITFILKMKLPFVCSALLIITAPVVAQTKKHFNFEQDLHFIRQYEKPIVLSSHDGLSQLVISTKHQGRVLTSTATGASGYSYGWLNYEALSNNKSGVGGEDRFWLAPIGSQYSIYYPKSKPLVESSWRVPKHLNTGAAILVKQTRSLVSYQKSIQVENYLGTRFSTELTREIKLLNRKEIMQKLGVEFTKAIRSVGFESRNKLTNKGDDWQLDTGMVTPWLLGMFKGNDTTVAIFPLKAKHGETPAISTYLYPLNKQRLIVAPEQMFFRVDGKYRSKIGIKSANTLPIMGYYDASNSALTIVTFSFEDAARYPDAEEGILKTPYQGDVINSYNHGAMDGSLLTHSSFFELESSAKLVPLKTGESISHSQQTYHFSGAKGELDIISSALLGISLADIPVFPVNEPNG